MSLFVELSISGIGGAQWIDGFRITNRGHSEPCPLCSIHPVEDCDLRDYEWFYKGLNGWVQHHRSDRALKLTQIVVNAMLGDENHVRRPM